MKPKRNAPRKGLGYPFMAKPLVSKEIVLAAVKDSNKAQKRILDEYDRRFPNGPKKFYKD